MANKTEAIDYNKFIGDPDEIEYVGMIDEIEVLSKPETPVRNEYQPIQLRIVDGSLYANDSDDNIFHHLGRIKGEPGIDGQDGRDGKDGERGPQGLEGIPGENGEKGDKGKIGISGEVGIDGKKGDKGEKGLSGVSIVGARGYQGLSGRDGKKGEDGRDGKVGVQGLVGKDGSRGIQGLIGIDGSIPDHEIDVPGSRFRFKEPSGKWGEWIRIPRGSGGGADTRFFEKAGENWRFNTIDGKLYAQKRVDGVWQNAGYFSYTS